MISEETWEKFRDGEVALMCPTLSLWKSLLIRCGLSITDVSCSNWEDYRADTCSYFKGGYLCYCSLDRVGDGSVPGELIVPTEGDFVESQDITSATEYPKPPQELISILRALATCKLIEKTHGVHLNLDELYDKREEYLEKWASEFEVHL